MRHNFCAKNVQTLSSEHHRWKWTSAHGKTQYSPFILTDKKKIVAAFRHDFLIVIVCLRPFLWPYFNDKCPERIVMRGRISSLSHKMDALRNINKRIWQTDVNQYLHSITVVNVSVSHVSCKITSMWFKTCLFRCPDSQGIPFNAKINLFRFNLKMKYCSE